MTVEKINSDDLGIQQVGKYIALQTRYELPNGADGTTLLVGVLASVTHALDAKTATVTRVAINVTSGDTYNQDLRNTPLTVGKSLAEVFLALSEQAKAETS